MWNLQYQENTPPSQIRFFLFLFFLLKGKTLTPASKLEYRILTSCELSLSLLFSFFYNLNVFLSNRGKLPRIRLRLSVFHDIRKYMVLNQNINCSLKSQHR